MGEREEKAGGRKSEDASVKESSEMMRVMGENKLKQVQEKERRPFIANGLVVVASRLCEGRRRSIEEWKECKRRKNGEKEGRNIKQQILTVDVKKNPLGDRRRNSIGR